MEHVKVITENRKARHDYHIEEIIEAGIALTGSEVKSLRAGKVNLRDSYARVEGGEVFLHNMHITPYEKASRFNHDPLRVRKLLLHKGEIRGFVGRAGEKGYTLVPLRLYFRRGLAKVELALARGKKEYDKRADIARREAEVEIARAIKGRRRERRAPG